ncbi:MAG: hypothetical protein B7C24_15130 [Bacteroidetes bacterium 4572_77]|nr:MAG: hypothetical protein B7C24_15130 [Bacteroidetes bacterium 4572_77]
MAAIGQIRKHYGLLVAIIGIALGAFILGDLFKGQTREAVNIGIVGDEEISYRDFSLEVEQAVETEKTNKQKSNLSSDEMFRIKQSTWNRMVKEIIIQKELGELGLTVTSEELFELVQGEEPHRYILQYFTDPETGKYKPELVLQYLQNLDQMSRENQMQWIEFERAIKEDQLNTKFNNMIAKAYYLPSAFAKMLDNRKTSEIELEYVAQLYSSIADGDVVPTDADYKKYYDEHRTDFKQSETRDIDYVVFNVKPTAEDRAAQKIRFDEYYDEMKTVALAEVSVFTNSISDTKYQDRWFKKDQLPLQISDAMFNGEPGATVAPYLSNNAFHTAMLLAKENRPDSLKASHILIAYAGASRAAADITRIKPQAKAIADSLLKVVKKSPKKLEEIAIAMSDDGGVKQNNGHYDWFPDGQMVPEFNQAIIDNKEGDVVVVETQFGFHVILIDGKKDFSEKVKVAMIDRSIEPSNQTYQDVYVKANEFASRCKTEAYDDVASEMSLTKRVMNDLGAMQESVPGQKQGRQIIIWAYREGREIGDIELFDMNGSYLVTTLTKINSDEYASLEDVKQNISAAVRNTMKAEQIMAKIDASSNKDDLRKLAVELNTSIDTATVTFESRSLPGFGPDADVIGAAAAMKKGDKVGPVKGATAVFMLQALNYSPSPTKTNYEAIATQMSGRFVSTVNFKLYQALEKQEEITDNRHLFY